MPPTDKPLFNPNDMVIMQSLPGMPKFGVTSRSQVLHVAAIKSESHQYNIYNPKDNTWPYVSEKILKSTP